MPETTPSYSFLERLLGATIPGTELRVSAVLLALLAMLGIIPVMRYILALAMPETLMLYVSTILLSALTVYYLFLAETHSEWLKKHPIAFIVITIGLLMLVYAYVPEFKVLMGETNAQVVGQLVTLLAHP